MRNGFHNLKSDSRVSRQKCSNFRIKYKQITVKTYPTMFISDVEKKEECKNEALQELRRMGIKSRPKKPKQSCKIKSGKKAFKVPLTNLPKRIVTLKTGQQVPVPEVVYELCTRILGNVFVEGIFRKEGSRNRQTEMKLTINSGVTLDEEDNVIDIAVLLKTFLRELPEPLIPFGYHELFLRCALLEQPRRNKAIFLACLLLPTEYLNTLAFLMQFFNEVAAYAQWNRMNPYNLAIVIAPNIFPIEERLSQTSMQVRHGKICNIIQILIENATEIGVLPESIITCLCTNAATEGDPRKKKRRSGSLTRMFNGLKKMVGGKTGEENHNVVTPDLLLTPINSNATKKRRTQANGISNKKKKELLNKLPENVLLNTPFTPCRTPVSMDLSGPQEKQVKGHVEVVKEKKSQWFLRSKSVKNLKHEDNYKNSANPKSAIERRWSAISQPSNLKKIKKRNSFAAVNHKEKTIDKEENYENTPEPDYIKVSKIEYEAIKNRVSAMERRISIELESVESQIKTENENNSNVEVDSDIEHVQTVYETLVHSEHMSPTTDQLAKRLSRELKIRRSAEQKIIRSPSARKIGSMRRKSKESEKTNSKITRHQSWHVPSNDKIEAIPRVSLKRGRPNTVLTGLPVLDDDGSATKELKRTRSSSVGDESKKGVSCNLSGSSDTWMSAEGFFATMSSRNNSSSFNGRASLARLRSQNAGMVLAKAKLFDKLKDLDTSGSSSVRSIPRAKVNTKIGSNRNMESRLSYRVRSLKYEERRLNKKSMSPRRRNGQFSQKQKLQIAKHYLNSSEETSSNKENIPDKLDTSDKKLVEPLKDCNRMERQLASPKYSTPRVTPHIKKSLNVRSPKRLCRTPVGVERSTPLRVLKTPMQNHV